MYYFYNCFLSLRIIILQFIHVGLGYKIIFYVDVWIVNSFLLLSSILLYGYFTLCLSIHLMVDIRIISRFCYYNKEINKKPGYKHLCTSFCMNICWCFSLLFGQNLWWSGWIHLGMFNISEFVNWMIAPFTIHTNSCSLPYQP
jgi:hypothetical protein